MGSGEVGGCCGVSGKWGGGRVLWSERAVGRWEGDVEWGGGRGLWSEQAVGRWEGAVE